jgi:hypothetical protein
MSLSIKPVYRNRQFVSSSYAYDAEARQWTVVSQLDHCAKNEIDPNASCHIVKGRQRARKAGPGHPLWLFKCHVHNCWFTVYPPGWVPFGRRSLVDLDPKGEAVISRNCWESTAFGATVDQHEKKIWPQCIAGMLAFQAKGFYSYGTRKTQLRHLHGATLIFGLNAGDGLGEKSRLGLGIELKAYQEAFKRIRDGPGPAAQGAACTGLLGNFSQPTLLLFSKMVQRGRELGFWGACTNH